MTVFIKCDDGTLVNAATVKQIRPMRLTADEPKRGLKAGGFSHYSLISEGETLKAHRMEIDASALAGVTIPAAAGAKAVLIAEDTEAGRPTMEAIITRWMPIIAWRIRNTVNGSGEPIFPESPASNETVYIELPDGRLLQSDVADYADLEAAKQDRLQAAQQAWDLRQGQ
ncbi:hypothetical protein [Plastoroseomonas hellenica]|uniref:hypothetical protein n=1 Tax=Plastoroseomonas hellenica TaxID=2687306 RepID=UPI001BAC6342|nr:hypothetical protein [Plastoroseomonas hellenica]MBR0647897.1 hypothetical protein [Plastoroseomonas hellenica]